MTSRLSKTFAINDRIGDLIELTEVSFYMSNPPPGPRFYDSFSSSFYPRTPPQGSSDITIKDKDDDKSNDKCFIDNY